VGKCIAPPPVALPGADSAGPGAGGNKTLLVRQGDAELCRVSLVAGAASALARLLASS
jgi:hypothetical protein